MRVALGPAPAVMIRAKKTTLAFWYLVRAREDPNLPRAFELVGEYFPPDPGAAPPQPEPDPIEEEIRGRLAEAAGRLPGDSPKNVERAVNKLLDDVERRCGPVVVFWPAVLPRDSLGELRQKYPRLFFVVIAASGEAGSAEVPLLECLRDPAWEDTYYEHYSTMTGGSEPMIGIW